MTTVISAEKIDDNSFYVDVLYYTGTSYSKSVYPTLARAFQKYALELMNGGSYKSRSIDIEINNKLYRHTPKPYFIKRKIYTKI